MAYIDPAVARVVQRVRTRVLESAAAPDMSWLLDPAPTAPLLDGPAARLTPVECHVLVAAALIELDIRFGSLFAALQAPLPARRPCVGLLAWLLGDADGDVTTASHDLVRRGLLAVDNPDDPRAEWTLRVPVPVWDALRTGVIEPATLPPHLTLRTEFPALEDVAVGASQQPMLARLPGLLLDPGLKALVVRGPRGAGRTTLLGAAAATLGQGVLIHDGDIGGPAWSVFEALTALCPILPVVNVEPGPGETIDLPLLRGLDRPLGVVTGRSGGLSGAGLDHALTLVLTAVGPGDRRRLWIEGGLEAEASDLEDIVDRFLLTPGNIRRAAPVARLQALSAGRHQVIAVDVRAATRTLRRQELETLATLLDPLPPDAGPVLSTAAEQEFETLLRRCRHRERLSRAAAQPGVTRGVRALFSGGSGTGKTLAARHLASLLDLDLYRIDLASVVNKYIGETERNLDRVLARAEELDVVLLLDEGDALMAKRTEVSNANDRYANLETNFLLQRLETFDGIVIVTSNAASRIDRAFLRRIDVTVDFLPPDAGQRWQILVAHLPHDHEVGPDVLDQVARRCDLTGGQLRNAALHATLLAVDGDHPVRSEELVDGIQREYRRCGAASPLNWMNGVSTRTDRPVG